MVALYANPVYILPCVSAIWNKGFLLSLNSLMMLYLAVKTKKEV